MRAAGRVAELDPGLGHGLAEGISTRMLVNAATLIVRGVAARAACRMALVRPITDDADLRETLDHAIDAVLAP